MKQLIIFQGNSFIFKSPVSLSELLSMIDNQLDILYFANCG